MKWLPRLCLAAILACALSPLAGCKGRGAGSGEVQKNPSDMTQEERNEFIKSKLNMPKARGGMTPPAAKGKAGGS